MWIYILNCYYYLVISIEDYIIERYNCFICGLIGINGVRSDLMFINNLCFIWNEIEIKIL